MCDPTGYFMEKMVYRVFKLREKRAFDYLGQDTMVPEEEIVEPFNLFFTDWIGSISK